MLDCAEIEATLNRYSSCERTTSGTRVATHCLYPSFERVHVFVVGHGDGFIVHDGGGAVSAAWEHGVERQSMSRPLEASARAFDCEIAGDQIRANVVSKDWLWSGIASVANASSEAARAAIGKARVTKEARIIQRAQAIFDNAEWRPKTKRDYVFIGKSGKAHRYDLAVEYEGQLALIEAVVPHPTSIAAKFLAFADTERQPGVNKVALFENGLSQEDKSLIADVADLLAFKDLARTDGRFVFN